MTRIKSPNPYNQALGNLFRDMRKHRGWIQSHIQTRIPDPGLDPSAYSNLEHGKTLPSLDKLRLLCAAFSVDRDDVLAQAYVDSLRPPEHIPSAVLRVDREWVLLTAVFAYLRTPLSELPVVRCCGTSLRCQCAEGCGCACRLGCHAGAVLVTLSRDALVTAGRPPVRFKPRESPAVRNVIKKAGGIEVLKADLKHRYEVDRWTIRSLAAWLGIPFNATREILKEADTTFRPGRRPTASERRMT